MAHHATLEARSALLALTGQLLDDVGGRRRKVRNMVRGRSARREQARVLGCALARIHQDARNPELTPCFQVPLGVAHRPASTHIELQLAGRLFEHAGGWFATLAVPPIGCFARGRVVWAMQDQIDVRPLRDEQLPHARVDLLETRLVQIAARHATLIRDDHEHETRPSEFPQGTGSARNQLDLLRASEKVDLAHDRPVAVQEYGRATRNERASISRRGAFGHDWTGRRSRTNIRRGNGPEGASIGTKKSR